MYKYFISSYNNFIETFILVKKRPLLFLSTLGIDFLFIFSFFFISNFLFSLVENHLTQIISAIENDVMLLSEFSASFNQILYLTIIFLFIVFILFIIFQNLNWFISNKIVGNKIKFFDFAKKFSLISLLYFTLISIFIFISIRNSINSYFMNTVYIEKIVPLILLFIFMLLFVNLSNLKYNFIKNIKSTYLNLHLFILPLIIIFSLFYFVDLISKLLFQIGIKGNLLLIITAIMVLKTISISSIYLIKIVKK